MYAFTSINHGVILLHALLVGLTPLIPIPFLDDWVRSLFNRRMVRQISQTRGVPLTSGEVDALLQEDFWNGCVESCFLAVLTLLRELLSKIFFWIEWRRAFNLVSLTYYTGFLLDAALLDGYSLQGSPEAPARLREAIRRARYGANLQIIKRLIRPAAFLGAARQLVGQALRNLPRIIAALPGAAWQGLRSTPGRMARGAQSLPQRVRSLFYQRIQVLLGWEKAPEIRAAERLAQNMQQALLGMDSQPFDALHARLLEELEFTPAPATDQ